MTSITIKEYFAVSGSTFSNKDAAKIGPVLDEMSKAGAITARDVVDSARSKNSPLHAYFEWDDVRAADLFRVEQARRMLRSIKVKYVENGETKEARAFQVTRVGAYETTPRQYRQFQVLYGDSAFAAKMMDSAIDDLRAWKRKYEPYSVLWDNFAGAFQQLINQISEWEEEYRSASAAEDTDKALLGLLEWREECSSVLAMWQASREQVQYIMQAIENAMAAFDPMRLNAGKTKRACLKCGTEFQSVGVNNRLCNSCSKSITDRQRTSLNAAVQE